MQRLPLTIVIPARKEEDVILDTLIAVKKHVKTPHTTLVVVSPKPSDKTKDIVKKYLKKDRTVKIVVNTSKKESFANALLAGFKKVSKGVVVPVMADMADDPKTIDKMYKIVHKWDIVCGSRYAKGGKKIGGPFVQGVLSRIVCLSLHHIIRIPTKDVSNAFKMYNRNVLKRVTIDPLKGVEISMDITLQAYFKGAKITEIPTTWMGREKGESKFNILERFPRYFSIYTRAIQDKVYKR